jgi:hypothetical protein
VKVIAMPVTTTPGSLRSHVLLVIEGAAEDDPADLAKLVADTMTDAEKVTAFAELLPGYIGDVLRGARNRIPVPSEAGPQRAPGYSRRVRDIGTWWGAVLDSRYAVNGRWVRLRAMTADEVALVATDRKRIADEALIIAARFNRLHDLMHRTGVHVVGDLAPDLAATVWRSD